LKKIASLLAGLVLASGVYAQQAAFPNRPIRIVVPFTPGGPADALARMMGQELTPMYGVQIIADNRPGAGGSIGADIVAKAPPDGHTLLLSNISDAYSNALYKNITYNFQRDFAPVSIIATTPFILVVHPDIPARSVAELIALARAKPGQITFGSAGTGITSHLAGELFKRMANVEMLHVPYKGQAPATTDLLGKQISLMFNSPVTSLPFVKSGKLRALGVSTAERIPSLPDVPTINESGLPGYDVAIWFGIVAPAATPAPILEQIARDMRTVLRTKPIQEKFAAMGVQPAPTTPAEFARVIRADAEKWTRVIREGNITVD
jgi:tripartite-type tricarboxylate transporter receptor subunit TctC